MVREHGISLKKKHGQHFLRQQSIVENMLNHVSLNPSSSIMEIGCGDGFSTQEIVKHSFARLWVFEIDHEWAQFVQKKIKDARVHVFEQDILQLDSQKLESHAPWTLLSNLPYNITFPILHLVVQQRHIFQEGVIMVQEEVAQKIIQKKGRGYGYISLYFQYYFEWKLLDKVPPTAFVPPPKVYSRLLYFKPVIREPIIHEEKFWKFIKAVFRQPRRTLKNNLAQTQYEINHIAEDILQLRAQQLSFDQLVEIWQKLQ